MKAIGRAWWVPLTLTTLVLVGSLVFLYFRTQQAGDREYQQHVNLLRTLRQLDAQSELDVLKLRTGLAVDYDVLTGATDRTSKLAAQICASLEHEPHDNPADLGRRCIALREMLDQKIGLIERFKSDHSVLHNSLAFLPTAASETIESLKGLRNGIWDATKVSRTVGVIDDLLLANIAFTQHATTDGAAQMRESLDYLDRVASTTPPLVADRISIFSAHARTILREQFVVDGLLNAISALPSGDAIDDISNVLLNEQQLAGVVNERERLYLAVLSAVLLALLLFAAIRLFRNFGVIRRSNAQLLQYGHGLEVLVADRVAELRDSESRMARLARYDALTGLPNRHLFHERLREAMTRADRDQHHMALMFVDLDHFKQINDSLGHAVGDAVLCAVAVRLRETMRDIDTVARLGGDEFTIICEDMSNAACATQVATKVCEALAEPLVVDGRVFTISASIGIAHHTLGCDDRDNLLRSADIAMYRAKDSGRNAFAVFIPEMAIEVNQRTTMEAHLRQALERREFNLLYQPKVEIATGRISGVEALLRWNCAQLGPISPAEFIPLAEEMGLIVAIGEWVLGVACAQGAAWIRDGLPPLGMAVNLSPRELRDPQLIKRIGDVLRTSGFPAGLLELELTEGVVMDDVERNIDTLKAIRQLGVRLAIDDFGTGYSSLAYLSRLPIQTLKIDRALIAPMGANPNASTLVSTVVTLAHSLELDVVAEGVETSVQRNLLSAMGCDHLQGYLFSKPVSADDLVRLIRTNQRQRAPRKSLVIATT